MICKEGATVSIYLLPPFRFLAVEASSIDTLCIASSLTRDTDLLNSLQTNVRYFNDREMPTADNAVWKGWGGDVNWWITKGAQSDTQPVQRLTMYDKPQPPAAGTTAAVSLTFSISPCTCFMIPAAADAVASEMISLPEISLIPRYLETDLGSWLQNLDRLN
jgi:hypothetical protein